MDFYKELNNIFEHLHSIRKLEKFISIDIKFPSKWTIPKSLVETTKVLENESPDPEYRFFSFVSDFKESQLIANMGVIKTIIKTNKEREEKERLFKNKVNELKMLFDKSDLDSLKGLTFDVKDKNLLDDGEFRELDELAQTGD